MRQMQIPRLYHELAYLWPRLSPPQDYAREAKAISDILAFYLSLPQSDGEISASCGVLYAAWYRKALETFLHLFLSL